MGSSKIWKTACSVLVFCVAMAISLPAQTFTTLATFDVSNGALPSGALVQGLDGNFYGTTANGGRQKCALGCGTVFDIAPSSSTLTTLHMFVNTDGANPQGALVLATNGNFYGTTLTGSGLNGNGSVFEITPSSTLTNFAQFEPENGAAPFGGLMQDNVNGNFYGTTFYGADGSGSEFAGTVFAMTPEGAVTTLHNFCARAACGGISRGSFPMAPLVQGTNGVLYGTTSGGGAGPVNACVVTSGGGCGTVFAIGTGGSLAVLHKFDEADGWNPVAGLVLGSDGNFYGTTKSGGTDNRGTVFKMTPAGALTTLHSFNGSDGVEPVAALIQATDGNFYGTTSVGGPSTKPSCGSGCGTIFQITPGGTLTTIHFFDGTDGTSPVAALVQGTDGNLYGTTGGNVGAHLFGTIFKLSLGLAPFVKTLPTAAFPGTEVFILGTNLNGATAVTFNGKSAVFTVVSATEIKATVPAGSTTGTVEVTTPSGTLSSNVPFRVF